MNSSKDDRGESKAKTVKSPTDRASYPGVSQADTTGGDFASDGDVQGEGNYDAAREYDDAQHAFAESGRVEQAAREAAPRSPDEQRQMEEAERLGKSRAKKDG